MICFKEILVVMLHISDVGYKAANELNGTRRTKLSSLIKRWPVSWIIAVLLTLLFFPTESYSMFDTALSRCICK